MKKLKELYFVALIMLFSVSVMTVKADDKGSSSDGAPSFIEITEGPESATYIPDTDDCPYSEKVPLPEEVQSYLWEKCKLASDDYKELYVFMLGLMDQESSFNFRAVSKTKDYGLCQTNKKWVYPDVKKAFGLNDITDCFDPYISIDCCFWELLHKLYDYGISERLYYYYNTGRTKGSSNENSKAMVQKWNKWRTIIWGSSSI